MRFATSYFASRVLRHVAADMEELARAGFAVVVHTQSENDLRFYRRTLADIVAASVERGLEVWLDPWGVGGVFGGEAFSDAALRQPDWRQVGRDGARLPACCPSHPGFRALFAEWLGAACETAATLVFFDEPHLHPEAASGCACAHCRAGALGADDALASFLAFACAEVERLGKQSAVCVLPDGELARAAALPGLASLGGVPFWALRGEEPEPCVARIGGELVAAARAARVEAHLWIQGFQIPAGRESEIERAVLAAARAGAQTIAIWGFEACAAMSALACERPAIAWRAFGDAMRRASIIET